MRVYIVDRWDSKDLCDADVVKVFLKEENAIRYKKEEEQQLERVRLESEEDGVYDVPRYVWRITKLHIEELEGNCEYRGGLK